MPKKSTKKEVKKSEEKKIYIVSNSTKQVQNGSNVYLSGQEIPFDQELFDINAIIVKDAKQ